MSPNPQQTRPETTIGYCDRDGEPVFLVCECGATIYVSYVIMRLANRYQHGDQGEACLDIDCGTGSRYPSIAEQRPLVVAWARRVHEYQARGAKS